MKLLRRKFLYLAAVGLPAVFALTWWMWWAEAPPQARVIPPEVILRVKEEVRLRNEKWEAKQAIDGAVSYVREANISDFFRRDTTALIERLREALQSNNADSIAARTADLHHGVSLLRSAARGIEKATEFLSDFGGELSPSLRKQVEEAIVGRQQTMKGQNWVELRASGDALDQYSSRLSLVNNLYSTINHVHGLGTKVSPKLWQQIEGAVTPLRQALKGDSWDQIDEKYQQLPEIFQYPWTIFNANQEGRRTAELLPPSERQDLESALAALDAALQGESWEEALARAKEVGTVQERIERTHNGLIASSCVRILSIDGGGIRGIIPAMFLAELEGRANAPMAKLFDYIVGTSTGGIIALGLAVPDPKSPSEPLHRAEELVKLYKEKGSKIFPEKSLKTIRGLFWPKYRAEGIEQVLKTYFGNDVLLRDALTNVVIPTYSLDEGPENTPKNLGKVYRHIFLDNYRDESLFIYMWEAARAASAAPTYFSPFRIPVPVEGGGSIALIDGGVFANNPAVHAVSIVKRREYGRNPYNEKHPMLLLSLGTGRAPRPIAFREAWSWGGLRWLGPILDITLSDPGLEDEVEQLMESSGLYFRLQPTLEAPAELDNTDEKNIEALKRAAKQYIDDNSSTFDQVVKQLKRDRPPECDRRVGPWE